MTTTVEPIAPVRPATEAEDTLEIVVAERHIRDGLPGYPWSCPVALSLNEAGHHDVQVSADHVHVNGRRYENPDSLAKWISDFDRGRDVHPERWVLSR